LGGVPRAGKKNAQAPVTRHQSAGTSQQAPEAPGANRQALVRRR
jgi:hypothetical protein